MIAGYWDHDQMHASRRLSLTKSFQLCLIFSALGKESLVKR